MATAGTLGMVDVNNKTLWKVQTGQDIILNTEGKYLDRNIEIAVKKGSASTPITTITANPTFSTIKTTNGYKITVSTSQRITPDVEEGYITTGQGNTISVTGSTVIPAAVITTSGELTVNPQVTTSTATNMNTASSGTYYLKITNSSTAGKVQPSYQVTTAGYTPTTGVVNGASVSVPPTYTSNSTVYIPTAIGSVIMTPGAGSVVGSSNIALSTSDTSGIYVTGSGAVSATAKIDTAGYTPTNSNFATGSSTTSSGSTMYVTAVTVPLAKHFAVTLTTNSYVTVNDGIYTWTITRDKDGNVTFT